MLNVTERCIRLKSFLVDYFRELRGRSCERESADAQGPRTADTAAGLAARLAGSGLQRGGDVHALYRARLVPGAVPSGMPRLRATGAARGSAPALAEGMWWGCQQRGSMGMAGAA